MLFKDLQKGYPVFLLDRTEITAKQGKIVDVSRPHFDNQNPTNTQMVVDVTIELDGKVQPVFVIPENSPVAYTDKLILSPDRDSILREVQAIMSRNEEELKLIPVREKTVKQCQSIIEEWNPAIRQQRETDERMTKMEEAVGKLRSDVNDKFDKIMQKLSI